MRKHLVQLGAATLAASALALGAAAAAGAADTAHTAHTPPTATAPVWTALNLIDGWGELSGATYGTPSYYIQNNVLYFRGVLSAAASSGPEVAVLPVGARPTHYLWLTYYNFGGNDVGNMEIEPSGDIFIYAPGAGGPTIYPSLAAISFPLSS